MGGAALGGAALGGAALGGAALEGAALGGAALEGASAGGAALEGAALGGASTGAYEKARATMSALLYLLRGTRALYGAYSSGIRAPNRFPSGLSGKKA